MNTSYVRIFNIESDIMITRLVMIEGECRFGSRTDERDGASQSA